MADGGTPDWESAGRNATPEDDRRTVEQLRAVSQVGLYFANLSPVRGHIVRWDLHLSSDGRAVIFTARNPRPDVWTLSGFLER